MGLRPPAPKAGASTDSATPARGSRRLLRHAGAIECTFRPVAREIRDESLYVLERPNRDKSSSRATRAVIVLLLLVSILLMVVITIGGWSKLEGAVVVQVFYIAVYGLMAFYCLRWSRGVLPLAAALGILLAIFAAVAGPAWFARDASGFAQADSLFGGGGLGAGFLGLLTLLLIPVQVLLIAFAAQGFRQAWNVEIERPRHELQRSRRGPSSATA
jgi:hypothetical protein